MEMECNTRASLDHCPSYSLGIAFDISKMAGLLSLCQRLSAPCLPASERSFKYLRRFSISSSARLLCCKPSLPVGRTVLLRNRPPHVRVSKMRDKFGTKIGGRTIRASRWSSRSQAIAHRLHVRPATDAKCLAGSRLEIADSSNRSPVNSE